MWDEILGSHREAQLPVSHRIGRGNGQHCAMPVDAKSHDVNELPGLNAFLI